MVGIVMLMLAYLGVGTIRFALYNRTMDAACGVWRGRMAKAKRKEKTARYGGKDLILAGNYGKRGQGHVTKLYSRSRRYVSPYISRNLENPNGNYLFRRVIHMLSLRIRHKFIYLSLINGQIHRPPTIRYAARANNLEQTPQVPNFPRAFHDGKKLLLYFAAVWLGAAELA